MASYAQMLDVEATRDLAKKQSEADQAILGEPAVSSDKSILKVFD